MADQRKPIPPNPPRWKPSQDPASIQVPGLDISAPVLDQIEQMEQLITLKLQNVDENFSKIHNLLANKVLPAFKRYAVATEPVREAAKFWTSFYEQAAQVRIPTFEDDYSTANADPQQDGTSETTQEPTQDHPTAQFDAAQSHVYEPSIPSTDESFIPGHAAVSSTPANARPSMRDMSEPMDGPSWTQSSAIHSVSVVQDFSRFSAVNESVGGSNFNKADKTLSDFDQTMNSSRSSAHETPLRSAKGKAKEADQSLLRRVLLPKDPSAIGVHVSPLKFRGKPKTPIPAKYNPFLSPGKKPREWDGVVDLRDVSLTTPQRKRKGKSPSRHHPAPTASSEDDDDSFDGLPPGMSPPVMMSPARPPRSMAELGLTTLRQTPLKEASALIARDLVRDIQYASARTDRHGYLHTGAESSMSTLPSPPSFSHYHHGSSTTDSSAFDTSIESMLRRLDMKLLLDERAASTSSGPSNLRPPESKRVSEPSSYPATPQSRPSAGDQLATPIYSDTQLDVDSDMDSMDEINNTAHPSAAFLMASAVQRPLDSDDDSFGSSDHEDDSLGGEGGVLAPIHPFAGSIEDDGLDDSFEDDMYDGFNDGAQEETVFGIPPHQRIRNQPSSGVRMSGEELLQDTIGYENPAAGSNRVPESPTPAGWDRG